MKRANELFNLSRTWTISKCWVHGSQLLILSAGKLGISRGLTAIDEIAVICAKQVCVISSLMEGGANVLSEAIVAGVPVLASRIAGNVGIVGEDYPGLFEVGNTRELARLLVRSEMDPAFLKDLRTRIKQLAPLFKPIREHRTWADLIRQMQTKH